MPRASRLTCAATALLSLAAATAARADLVGLDTFQTNGTAYRNGDGSIALTPAANDQRGSAFSAERQPFAAFTANFTFTNVQGGGADGFTFVLQNDGRGAAALSNYGGEWLGYGGDQWVNRSVAGRFRDYPSSYFGYRNNGGLYGTDYGTGGTDLRDTAPVDISVKYDSRALRTTLTQTRNGTTSTWGIVEWRRDIAFELTRADADRGLDAVTDGKAYVGFTAATGGANTEHRISNFSYTAGQAYTLKSPGTPVAVTGFNHDVLYENTNAGAVFNYDRGFPVIGMPGTPGGRGLPANGTVVSNATASAGNNDLTTGATTFQLQDYGASNALHLGQNNGGQNFGTLNLASPGAFSFLSLLVSRGGGGCTIDVTMRYTDGSAEVFKFDPPDWYDPNNVNSAFAPGSGPGWIQPNGGNYDGNPTFFEVPLPVDSLRSLTGLDFYTNNAGGSDFAVFAVSGTLVPEPATIGVIAGVGVGLLSRRRRTPPRA
jgi:hypothetical protein